MTSKISYLKLVKEDIKRRGWLAALACIGMLIILPVLTMQGLDSRLMQMKTSDGLYTRETIIKWLSEQLGYQNNILICLVILGAILCGITGFSYLHSREKVDFYHGLWLRREKLFSISYISGFIMFFIPYIVSHLLCYLIGELKGISIPDPLFTFLKVSLFHILFFLLIYSLTILSMMLTGKIIIGILGGFVFFAYGPLIVITFRALCVKFLSTYPSQIKEDVQIYTSPVTAYFGSAIKLSESEVPLGLIIGSAAGVFLFTASALLLYRIRASEAAENAMAFTKTESIIKILLVTPLSIFIGLFLVTFTGYKGAGWIVTSAVLSAIILCAAIEFIYHMDLSLILKKKYSSGIALVLVLTLLGMMNYDVFGFDTYLPDKNKIEKMSLNIDRFASFNTYGPVNESNRLGSDDMMLEHAMMSEFEAIYELAQTGIEYVESCENKLEVKSHEDGTMISTSVKYLLKSGKSVYRSYYIKKSEALNCLQKLSGIKGYTEKLFPVFYIAEQSISQVKFSGFQQEQIPLDLKKSEQIALLKTYQNDIREMNIKEMKSANMVGEFTFTLEDGLSAQELSQVYLYKENRATIELLEEYGYPVVTAITTDDIAALTVTDYRDSDTVKAKSYQFDKPADIQEIITSVCYFPNSFLDSETEHPIEVKLILKNGKTVICYFHKGAIPPLIELK